MNSIQALHSHGQSIWLDFISRSLLTSGELKRLIEQGVTGVTSNPSIFQKSICETSDYDNTVQKILKSWPDIEIPSLYEKLAIEDIQMAADVLRPVYDSTGGTDGFVSLEVSPHLAALTESTVNEAQRLWSLVGRSNLMIKVPATPQGLPAIEALISQGINVNATLIFSLAQYHNVAHAYIRGLEGNPAPHQVASVASFFVSRIDSVVDKALENSGQPEALEMRGKIAVDCAKVVYQRFREIFYGGSFKKQKDRGGKVQKLVWGSTGTKNPAYSDVIYVEEIIGPDTINTIPMSTLQAFLNHGQARLSLSKDIETAVKRLASLKRFGIDMNTVTEQLLQDGVKSFTQAYDQLIDSLKGRCALKP